MRKRPSIARQVSASVLSGLSLAPVMLVYALHFFFGGGRYNTISDSYAYLERAAGRSVGIPFNTRLLQPWLASAVASLTGFSIRGAFNLLTPVELLAALLLVRGMLIRRGASRGLEAAVMISFGCSLAATFGYTPVLVDPLVLLLTCAVITLLDHDRLILALIAACVAALAKEYMVTLGFVWALHARNTPRRRVTYLCAFLPIACLSVAAITSPAGAAAGGFQAHQEFLRALFGYHLSLIQMRGPFDYLKILYMWSWSALWPMFTLAIASLLPGVRRRDVIKQDRLDFALMLIVSPILFLGDWGRSLLLVVPFSLSVAATHPLSEDPRFVWALATGGAAAALARPIHTTAPAPPVFTLGMTATSMAASLLLMFLIARFFTHRDNSGEEFLGHG